MDQALFWLTNTATDDQQVNLFDTSDQSGKGATEVWNFSLDWIGVFDGSNWFKSATALAPRYRDVQYTKTNGGVPILKPKPTCISCRR